MRGWEDALPISHSLSHDGLGLHDSRAHTTESRVSLETSIYGGVFVMVRGLVGLRTKWVGLGKGKEPYKKVCF